MLPDIFKQNKLNLMIRSTLSHRNHIKVFVASTVYNFESELNRIYETLDNFGYDVMISHKGTIPLDSKKSNLNICLGGVNECDVFVGFIRPDYGSGVLEPDGKSITHLEFEKAVERGMPRFILADYRVPFARSLIRKAEISYKGEIIKISSENINFQNDNIMDIRCVQLYEKMIQQNISPKDRVGHWVQSYVGLDDILLHIDAQFKYPERIKKLIDKQ